MPLPADGIKSVNQILIQIIGFVGLLFVVLSFQKNTRGAILLFLAIAQVFFTLHFSLLSAWTGAAMNGLAAIRTFMFYKRDTVLLFKNPLLMYIFMAVFILAGFMTWQAWYSVLLIIAMVADTYAVWNERTSRLRAFMLIPRPLWFTYNLIVGSYAGLTTEIFVFLSILIGIIRFDMLKKS